MIAKDLLIIKYFLKMGIISKHGGGEDMPEVDSDLEDELEKGV
jgi:hypothetical protein